MSVTKLNIGRQSNQHFDENADGFTLGGGTTQRDLTLTGADVTVTGAGTNTYTFPASTDTLVGRASTDTLTNKTLTSPVVNTPTGIVKGDVGLGNVTNDAQLKIASNLSDVANAGTSRTNLSVESTTQLNTRDTNNRNTDNHTNGTTNKVYTATEQTKLSGVEAGATANSTDATLLARANHTGTQTMSTISDAGDLATKSTVASTDLVEAFIRGRKQEDTTNSAPTGLTLQHGWGFITGDGSVGVQKTVTFPTAFSSSPIVMISYAGARLVSAGTPTDISDFDGSAGNAKRYAALSIITTTSFEATTGDFDNTNSIINYAFTWIAIGA